VDRLPEDLDHEGAGDALPFTPEGGHTVLLSGYSFRSDARAATALADLLGCPVRPIQLVDPRLYHLDLTFCPLDGRRALVAPLGWDRLRPQGGGGPGARAAGPDRRGDAVVLRQLGGRGDHGGDAGGDAAGGAPARGVAASTWSSAGWTSS
jgi:hypothetical protein